MSSVSSSAESAVSRHRAAAALRALAGDPSADFGERRVQSARGPVDLASVHLAVDFAADSRAAIRGAADGLGLLLAHCDLDLHRRLAPDGAFERLVFDIAEQIRCESLAPTQLDGVPGNLQAAFDRWACSMQAQRVTESVVGLTLFGVAHMVRARFAGPADDPLVEGLEEGIGPSLLPLIGPALRALPDAAADQQAYARLARRIAVAAAAHAGAALDAPAAGSAVQRARWVMAGLEPDDPDPTARIAPAAADAEGFGAGAGREASDEPLESLGGYSVFTRELDCTVAAETLAPELRLVTLRSEIDEQRRTACLSMPGLARRTRAALGLPATDGWDFGATEGFIDGARLARLAVDPTERRVFRHDRTARRADAAVTFLVDTSGSMKQRGLTALAALVDTMAQAVELAGARCEVLGFTTSSWAGGRARSLWHSAGEPHDPGRLAELLHIVYCAADTPRRRARRSLSAMASPHHYRESVYGEALIWAARRLWSRRDPRRILVLVSDGAPTESATAAANTAGFLAGHFAAVAAALDRRADIELAALTVGGDLSKVIGRCASVDLDGPLRSCCDAVVGLFHPPHGDLARQSA